jgi:PP-loop superfamily ATP-utilizing enzyme
VRVRHLGANASIEVERHEVERLIRHPRLPRLLDSIRRLGWPQVDVDPSGYRLVGTA